MKWIDKSGNGNDATLTNTGVVAKKIQQVNGKAYIAGEEITPSAADLNRTDITTEGQAEVSKVVTMSSLGSVNMGKKPFVGGRMMSLPDTEYYRFLGLGTESVTIADDASLDFGTDDFMIEILFEADNVTDTMNLINKYDATTGFLIQLNTPSTGDISLVTKDASHTASLIINDQSNKPTDLPGVEAGTLIHCLIGVQNYIGTLSSTLRAGSCYLNGISTTVGGAVVDASDPCILTIDNAADVIMGLPYTGSSNPFTGNIHFMRLWRGNIGENPIGVYTNEFISNLANLDPIPYRFLDASGAEILSETDFATHANWATTGGWTDTGLKAEWTWSADQTSTLTQASGGFATALEANKEYQLQFTLNTTTVPDGTVALTLTTGIATTAVTLPTDEADIVNTSKRYKVQFTTNNNPGDFVLSVVASGSSQGQFDIDDISLKRVGVAVSLDADGIAAGTWLDSTSNANSVTVANATVSNMRTLAKNGFTTPGGKYNFDTSGDNYAKIVTNNNPGFWAGGSEVYRIDSGGMIFNANAGNSSAKIVKTTASATVPIYAFNGDTNTGVGWASADKGALIANGSSAIQFDADTTAGNTRLLLYDVDNGTLERVTVGAADSGGAGFKVLRIPN